MPHFTTTENGALSYATTKSKCLDAFYAFVRGIDEEDIKRMVQDAYNEHPLLTLKLIFHRRDCRGGIGERRIFRVAIQQYAILDLATVIHNLHHIPTFGRWDDLFCLIPYCKNDVIALLVKQIREDHDAMMNGQPISLCAKWLPTEKNTTDVKYDIIQSICFQMEITPRDFRQQYLSPMRRYLNLVEILLSKKQCDAIVFEKVPSQAMHKLKKAFENHCPQYDDYKEVLQKGETTVNAGTMDPHQLIKACLDDTKSDVVIEAQWDTMVKEMQENGDLGNALAIVDTSGSMYGTPIHVAIALGLFTSQCTSDCFKHLVLTFSTNPRFFHVNKKTLLLNVKRLYEAPWGGSTNFQKCFKLILQRATLFTYPDTHDKYPSRVGLHPDDMPTKLICISDMQFNHAGRQTNFEAIQQQYADAGYPMPTLVFWNVSAYGSDVPVETHTKNVVLMSGFNTSMLKRLMMGRIGTPYITMLDTLNEQRYNVLELA